MSNVLTIKIDFDKKEIGNNGNIRSGFNGKKHLIEIITRELETETFRRWCNLYDVKVRSK